MIRRLAALLVVVAILASARASIPVYQAGAGKKTDPSAPADARKKIIAAIDADGENAIEQLNRNEAAKALASQKRILDNIDELLKQQNSEPSSARSQNPPSRPQSPAEPKPSPKSNESDPGKTPPQAPQEKPQPKKAVEISKNGESTNGADEVRKLLEKNDTWGKLAPRLQQEMNAIPRDRYIRNYEEMLRAYYRNIADSSRRKDAD